MVMVKLKRELILVKVIPVVLLSVTTMEDQFSMELFPGVLVVPGLATLAFMPKLPQNSLGSINNCEFTLGGILKEIPIKSFFIKR